MCDECFAAEAVAFADEIGFCADCTEMMEHFSEAYVEMNYAQ